MWGIRYVREEIWNLISAEKSPNPSQLSRVDHLAVKKAMTKKEMRAMMASVPARSGGDSSGTNTGKTFTFIDPAVANVLPWGSPLFSVTGADRYPPQL
jgi:hypothetical protein